MLGSGGSNVAEELKNDPPIGSRPNSLVSKGMTPQRKRFVIVISSCLCNESLAAPIASMVKQGGDVYVVAEASQERTKALAKFLPVSVKVMPDAKAAIAKSLNAFFFPRCYLLNPDGTLAWAQTEPDMSLASAFAESKRDTLHRGGSQ